ncbi:MAG: AMP-binding protein [Alphaproteobacteria bacterium]
MTTNANLYAILREAFWPAADRPALIEAGGATLTYGDLDRLSARFAGALAVRGVGPGDRVVVQADKSPGHVALFLAVLRLGAVHVPLNTGYTAGELAYFLDNAEPRVLVCRPEATGTLDPVARTAGLSGAAALGTDDRSGLWAEALQTVPRGAIEPRDAEDLASIIYTSGTTGRSKGAMLSHGNLAFTTRTLHRLWGFAPDDVMLHVLPIFHVHGLFFGLLTSFLNATPILFHRTFDAEAARRDLAGATVFMGVPTHYGRLLDLPGFGVEDCATMRLFVSGSAPLTAQAWTAWQTRTGHAILERYGMSEAGVITSNPLDGARVPGTVGFAFPHTDVVVADGEGREVPRGQIGVVEARGPGLFKGYWRMPDKTAEDHRADGFFITGDNGVMDAEGRLTIVGRAKDLIISGGYNIYPKEIEAVLDAIDGVKESAVIGAPHGDLGEGVVAILVAQGQPVDMGEPVDMGVIQAALDDALARFKHPRVFYWVDALPRNTMGKVQKSVLRDLYRTAYAKD